MVKNKLAALTIQKPNIYVPFSNSWTNLDCFIQKENYFYGLLCTKCNFSKTGPEIKEHSKTGHKYVQFSNILGIRMSGIQTFAVVICTMNDLNKGAKFRVALQKKIKTQTDSLFEFQTNKSLVNR
jgi:hypothetical protein